jgi:hypothetical protein
MALPPDVQAAWDQVGTQTTELGVRIDALSAQIAAGMTDAAAADLRAKFDAESAVLKGYAVTPPVPPPGPAPVAKKKP